MQGDYKAKSDKVFNMIKSMKQRGENECPIDGVGFQNHININYDEANYESIRENIQRYTDINVEVQFTETNVRCSKHMQDCQWTNWPESALETQASIYGKILQICLEEPNCTAFETWDFTDKYSKYPNSLPFDKEFGKKPAYEKILETLEAYKP